MKGVHVPMNILLAYGTPFTHILHGSGALDDDEIGPFFDGVNECVSRWLHYLNQQINYTETQSFYGPVEDFRSNLLDLTYEDGWDTFEIRDKARHSLIEFEHICSDMARSFTHPPRVKEFYHNLASRGRATLERLVEGDE